MSINKDIHSTKQLEEKMDSEYVFIDVASPLSVDSGSISEDDLSNNTQNLILELLGLNQTTIPEEVTTFNMATVTNDNIIPQQPTNSSLSLLDDNYATDESVWQMQHKSTFGKAKVGVSKQSLRTTEQRLRKKVQNRKAASRYRDKKKYELGDIFNGAAELEKLNNELKERVSGLQVEINYLKNLMLDVIQARLSNNDN